MTNVCASTSVIVAQACSYCFHLSNVSAAGCGHVIYSIVALISRSISIVGSVTSSTSSRHFYKTNTSERKNM